MGQVRSQCFLPRVSQAQALNETARAAELNLGEAITPFPPFVEKGVREPDVPLCPGAALTISPSPPAHPSNRLLTQLNANWRVVDDPLQWILQRRKGNPRKRNSGWIDRSFCTTREGLVRCIREYCAEVDQNAFAELKSLPEHHADVEQPK